MRVLFAPGFGPSRSQLQRTCAPRVGVFHTEALEASLISTIFKLPRPFRSSSSSMGVEIAEGHRRFFRMKESRPHV